MQTTEKPSLLIVDDSRQNIRLLSSIINKNGYHARGALSGAEALSLLNNEKFDLILLDLMMPEMDGIETCRLIRENENTRKIPIIFITAVAETDDMLKAFTAGAVDYITKPFIKEVVLARIGVHIRLKMAIEKLEEISVTDELTGVFNRRFAYQTLERYMEMVRRGRETFLLSYIDIDNLKFINDTLGHHIGDSLIITVVEAFKSSMRKTDYIFRMGGDEFLLLFPRAAMHDSVIVLERIQRKLKRKRIKGNPVEFSYGCVEYRSGDMTSLEELLLAADSKMYEMKHDNRKRRAGRK
ncbi:MAG: hypothetical protein CVV44_06755 [Spirochaetae bacterium HGW-Spirochaetae-1]|jgi:diguanylate cyclase (GGDEF)-like protein|nr:MAG: hypothetical protein CVV44_06755 [Spirochaetae bacterium HGW-Spirochaetae-1]